SRTIAQDEATSIVWGMPGEAVAVGAAAEVLPLGEIYTRVLALAAEMDITRPIDASLG
ncbi:MAG: Chemotaxis-specific methylesterase, partial [Gammaproteobacteria bacterium]|nr:Chemotaxis-specific methylesterase [Gammaproteobacteria bacterium]